MKLIRFHDRLFKQYSLTSTNTYAHAHTRSVCVCVRRIQTHTHKYTTIHNNTYLSNICTIGIFFIGLNSKK